MLTLSWHIQVEKIMLGKDPRDRLHIHVGNQNVWIFGQKTQVVLLTNQNVWMAIIWVKLIALHIIATCTLLWSGQVSTPKKKNHGIQSANVHSNFFWIGQSCTPTLILECTCRPNQNIAVQQVYTTTSIIFGVTCPCAHLPLSQSKC
jgi:hypothetical protein